MNKYTSLKLSFLEAFSELDGVQGLVTWGRRHRTAFYTLLARLLPASVQGEFDFNVRRSTDPDQLTDAELEKIARLPKTAGKPDSGERASG